MFSCKNGSNKNGFMNAAYRSLTNNSGNNNSTKPSHERHRSNARTVWPSFPEERNHVYFKIHHLCKPLYTARTIKQYSMESSRCDFGHPWSIRLISRHPRFVHAVARTPDWTSSGLHSPLAPGDELEHRVEVTAVSSFVVGGMRVSMGWGKGSWAENLM